jgi:hypothetical protein
MRSLLFQIQQIQKENSECFAIGIKTKTDGQQKKPKQ